MNLEDIYQAEDDAPLPTGKPVVLTCPGCAGNFIHIDGVVTATSKGEAVAVNVPGEGEAPRVEQGPWTAPGKRHTMILVGYCEFCGCHFNWNFLQHKGQTIFKAEIVAESSTLQERKRRRRKCQSPPEQQLFDALTTHTHWDIQPQHKAGRYRIDLAIPDRKIAIEVDGLAYHNGQESFQRDQQRQRDLQALGWTVIRFTAKEVTSDPARCLREIERLAA